MFLLSMLLDLYCWPPHLRFCSRSQCQDTGSRSWLHAQETEAPITDGHKNDDLSALKELPPTPRKGRAGARQRKQNKRADAPSTVRLTATLACKIHDWQER